MTTTSIVTVFGAILVALVLLYVLVLMLRRRRLNRDRQLDLYDSAMRSKWNRKG